MSSTWIKIVSCIAIHIIAPTFAVTSGLPLGNYALPMTRNSLCGFDFAEYRHQWDDEDTDNINSHSSSYYKLLNGHQDSGHTRQHYCQRKYSGGDSTQNLAQWPAGKYCVLKKQGNGCPNGFQSGRLYMDTQDTIVSERYVSKNNDVPQTHGLEYGPSPVVNAPYGGTGAAMDFCCRSDGDVNRAMNVVKSWSNAPSEFALYPKVSTCQKINGYASTMVWRFQDNEDDDNHNERYSSGSLPFGELNRNTKIYICHYRLMQPVNGRCSLDVLSIDHIHVSGGKYFNFDKTALDAVLGRTDWSGNKLMVGNGKTVVVWRNPNGGSKGDAHGRYDPYGTAKKNDWSIGDKITFADCQNGSWRKGKAGATCDQTCNAIGKRCNSDMQSKVRSCTDIAAAANAAGVSCAHHSSCFGRTDRDREYAGTPFISQQNGLCYFLGDGARSVCNSNAGEYHEPLCYCV